MLKQQKHTELLNEQSSAENHNTNNNSSSNYELTYEEKYDESGIWIRGNIEEGYFATAGMFRISNKYETIDKLKEKLDNKDWEIIIQLVITLVHFITTGQAAELNKYIEQKK